MSGTTSSTTSSTDPGSTTVGDGLPGGTYDVGGLTLTRFGFGAMQLAGPGVFGPPRDREAALDVLRTAADLGITHVDTSDYYGPTVTTELIREALAPYPAGLHLVTKVGARRDAAGGWPVHRESADLVRQVHENLEHLGLETLDVVNLRMGGFDAPEPGSLAEPFGALAELREQGLVRPLGLSTVSPEQLAEAQAIAPVVCVQNRYSLAHREDEAMLRLTAEQGIAYVPFFPLGGFSAPQSRTLEDVAARLGVDARGVALAWLLQRSPNVLVIAGTSSARHLRENVAGAGVVLPADALAELDAIGG